ncbi:CoA transferase [bacterium]|nr:MAG: CoA transferase [bacterium]
MNDHVAAPPPLAGIRVVDVTRALAGPFCTMLLGDQGAEVIKIEQPGVGDTTRHQANPSVQGENSAFLAVNRNKKSVTLDLRKPEGQRIARELIRRSDVFVENFRPGKAADYGLDSERLLAENPRLIYCSISGWGPDGPYAHKAGYAATAEAISGLMSMTGERDGPPAKLGVSIIDNLTGLFAKDAITAALYARERSGRGQRVDTSLMESATAVLSMAASSYLIGGVVAGRWGSEHEWNTPWKALQTKDGWLMLAAGSEGTWRQLCEALGIPEMATDPRFTSMGSRAEHRGELYTILERIIATRTTAEWLAVMDATGTAAAPVNTVDEVFKDPQVLHRQMLLKVKHATLGEIPQVGFAEKFSDTACVIQLPPPVLGAHTEEVLRELAGCTPERIQDLRSQQVI